MASTSVKTPASNFNVEVNKPNVERCEATLPGFIATSFNGGHNRTLRWFRVQAGTFIKQHKMHVKIKLLTPITPSYQPLYMTVNTYFVPDSRVWKNAHAFESQRASATDTKIKNIPFIPTPVPTITGTDTTNNNEFKASIMQTTLWRDSFISAYVPRMGMNVVQDSANTLNIPDNLVNLNLPKYNALLLRGRVAIYNDYERDKNYDAKVVERFEDSVSEQELKNYFPTQQIKYDFYTMRAKKPNSYYTDYRTSYQGFESELPLDLSADKALVLWSSWESKIAESRLEPSLANLTDEQIIQKLRGSKLLTEGKTQHIGQNTIRLNYSSVTQNTYNNAEEVLPQYRVMGQQGAYSFTEVEIPTFAGFHCNETGTIHIIANVWAPTVFSTGFDRTALNIEALDQYRPELVDDKFDVLYEIECGSALSQNTTNVIGYKRRFTENFRLPNCVNGDLLSTYFKQVKFKNNTGYELEIDTTTNAPVNVMTQDTYQFFETDRLAETNPTGLVDNNRRKKVWKDYTDLMLAKNQAIMPKIEKDYYTSTYEAQIMIYGQNQIDIIGEDYAEAILPISEKVKNNYSNWGEH